MTLPAILAGLLTGAAFGLAVWALIPSSPSLSDALGRLSPANLDLTRAITAGADSTPHGIDTAGAWVERHLGATKLFAPPSDDLEILQVTPASFYAEKTVAAACGFAAPAVFGAADHFLFHLAPASLPAFLALVGAAVLWFVPDWRVRARAQQARREFTHAAVLYFELVAVNRRSEKGVTSSLESAADVSDAWMFARIREELTRARWASVSAWDSLDNLGQRTKIRALSEMADIMRLAGDSGVAVVDSLVTGAEGMRDLLLAEEFERAARTTSRTAFPRTALVMLTLIALATPAVLQLLG